MKGSQDNISKIKQNIINARKLSEVLKPEKFAPPGGWADLIVNDLRRGKNSKLKTTQLRKIFTEVKEICEKQIKGISEDKTELYLLYPKLAYAYGRDLMPRNFYELLIACLDKLKNSSDKEDFRRFKEFMTAIVAYNKQYE
ncbi:type III-A CRISPR-associated protein Csm2 [Persephonella sp.]